MIRKKIIIGFLSVTVIILVLFFIYVTSGKIEKNITEMQLPAKKADVTYNPSINKEYDIKKQIVNSLASHQKKNGFIDYSYNFLTKKYSDIDNIIHQLETGIVYIDFLEKNPNDKTVKQALHRLLNNVTEYIRPGKFGPMLVFYAENEDKDTFIKQLRAEISATALMITAMARYRILYSELDFATTESYITETLIKTAEFLLTTKQYTNLLYRYPPYELWYALATITEFYPKNRNLNIMLTRLDRFYASSENHVTDPDSMLYFFRTYIIRKKHISPYVTGAVLRNIRNYNFVLNNTAVLDCQNAALINYSSKILSILKKDEKRKKYLKEQYNLLKKNNLKFFISNNNHLAPFNKNNLISDQTIKKFTGFFILGYGNPITTMKNSINCYYAFD